MRPHMEEEHRREVPSQVMMKSKAMARALDMEVQREVEFFNHLSSDEQALGEGLEAYVWGIDATMMTGCEEDPETYKEISTSTDHRWVRGRGVELRSLQNFLILRQTESQEQWRSEPMGQW